MRPRKDGRTGLSRWSTDELRAEIRRREAADCRIKPARLARQERFSMDFHGAEVRRYGHCVVWSPIVFAHWWGENGSGRGAAPDGGVARSGGYAP